MKNSRQFTLEIDKWPNNCITGFKTNLSGEVVPMDISTRFELLFVNKGTEFEYFLRCPETMSDKEGWYMSSTYYMTIEQLIDKMELPFKIRHFGFKSWLN